MTTLVARALDLPGGRGVHLFERNVMSHRRTWAIIVSAAVIERANQLLELINFVRTLTHQAN